MATRTRRMRIGFSCIMAVFVLVFLQVRYVCAEEISKEFRTDIVKLLKITGAEGLGLQMGVAVANQVIDSLVKKNPNIPSKAVEAIKDEISKVFAEEMPKLMAEIVPIYAKHFTQDEVKGLIVFYSTPLGKKTIETMPALMNECMQAGQAWGKAMAPGLGPRLESRLKREGFDNQNRFLEKSL
jgi:hypothetical protein